VGFSETVLAAMIGATATVGTAIFQLVMHWRKQAGDRRVSKGGFRSLLWMLTLLLASGVAGFAYSEYLNQAQRDDAHQLRQELQQQLATLASSTAKLEQVRLNAQGVVDAQTRQAEERRRGVEGVEGLVQLPACKGRTASGGDRLACAETDAQRVAVCTVVPASAQVTEVQLFTRPEDSQQPWGESRVEASQDAGKAKFLDAPFERVHTDNSKQVCFNFAHWGADKGRMARIVVKYTI
jgi:ribosomal protein L20